MDDWTCPDVDIFEKARADRARKMLAKTSTKVKPIFSSAIVDVLPTPLTANSKDTPATILNRLGMKSGLG